MTRALLVLLCACTTSTPVTTPAAATVTPPAPAQEAPPAPPASPAAVATTPAAPSGPGTAGDPTAGAAVYAKNCVPCHQADGTGMNGMLGANFVADKTRLAKSDEELLTSIANGLTGKIGTMPPWGKTLTEQERRDALAYIRATFGGH